MSRVPVAAGVPALCFELHGAQVRLGSAARRPALDGVNVTVLPDDWISPAGAVELETETRFCRMP